MQMALERRGVPGRRGRPDQPARHVDAARRQARGRGDLDGLRRPRSAATARVARDQRDQVDDRPHDGRRRRVRGVRDGHVGRRAVRARRRSTTATPTPSATSGSCHETHAAADPLRAVEQHRPRRPQRRGHLQALRRRLTSRRAGCDSRDYNRRHCIDLEVAARRLNQDPARRAVVTGLGAVMPIGNDFPTYWSNLRRRRDRDARRSSRFDASAFEVRIAAEVLDFDPTTVDGRQDGPPDEPLHPPRDGRRQGGRRATPGIDFAAMDRGPARPGRRRRQHRRRRDRADHRRHPRPRPEGPALRVSPFAVPALSGSMARLHAVDGVRPDRARSSPRSPPARRRSSPSTTRCG